MHHFFGVHLLNLRPDYSADGRSLFDANRSDKVLLFATNRELVVGYRKGQTKYMYYTVRNGAKVYDLKNDPAEQQNIFNLSSTSENRDPIMWIKSVINKPF
jgi:hypothetical protein